MSEVQNKRYFDFDVLNPLIGHCCDHLDELTAELDVKLKRHGKMFVGCCPVHGGDNVSSFNIYPEGRVLRGNWKCRTHHCEEEWSNNFIGFVRGTLSQIKDAKVTWEYAVDWLCTFFKIKLRNIKTNIVGVSDLEKRKYQRAVRSLSPKAEEKRVFQVTRNMVRKTLTFPSWYYEQRGFSVDILNKYDVGMCDDQYKRMQNRAVVPQYDNTGQFMVGCAGRTIFEKCSKCKLYHNEAKPCPVEDTWQYVYAQKWLLSKGFNDKDFLYNLWFAKRHIEESGIAILVEGRGDVWKLEENGVHIAVGLSGTTLTDPQLSSLEASGAMSLVVLTDNDPAGIEAAREIKKKCERMFRLYFPKYNTDDVADMNSDEVTDDIRPILHRALMENAG